MAPDALCPLENVLEKPICGLFMGLKCKTLFGKEDSLFLRVSRQFPLECLQTALVKKHIQGTFAEETSPKNCPSLMKVVKLFPCLEKMASL